VTSSRRGRPASSTAQQQQQPSQQWKHPASPSPLTQQHCLLPHLLKHRPAAALLRQSLLLLLLLLGRLLAPACLLRCYFLDRAARQWA
jgi:hypothetical protein